jgi:hypothetical protein
MDRLYPSEFREIGGLQEVNRLFFHPIGMALVTHINISGEEEFEIIDVWGERGRELKIEDINRRHMDNALHFKERFLSRIQSRIQQVGDPIQRLEGIDDRYTIEDNIYGLGWYTSGNTVVKPEDQDVPECEKRSKYLERKYEGLIGLLTTDVTLNLKFKIVDVVQSRELQEVLFKLNFGWAFVDKPQELRNLESNYIILTDGKLHTISTESDFNVMSQQEYTLPR